MKILHIVTSVDPQLGGVAESIRSRGVKLKEMGHEVEVVSFDHPNASFVPSYELKLHALGSGKTKWQYHSGLIPWLRSKARDYDAVIVDGIWQYHCYAARKALKGTGVPYYVFTHGMLDPWFKRTYPLKHLKKWLFWPWSEYRVLRDAKAVLFTCEEEMLLARESFWLYRANERLAPLGTTDAPKNGENLANIFFRHFDYLRDKSFLLFLGRVHPKKGCDLLISALAQTGHDQHLVIAGPADPNYLSYLQELSRKLGIDERVHWIGMVKEELKWGALYACDAFILPSHQENFGFAVVEALACAKPVMISKQVNIWREVEGDGGGLVASDTLAGTSSLLNDWFDKSLSARISMRERARETFERRYTVEASASALLDAMRQ